MSKYTFDGIEYPGVTTITGQLDKSSALMGWAVKCQAEWIKQNSKKENGFYKLDDNMLNEARYHYKEVSETALDDGSKTHDLIEQYIKHDKDKTEIINNYSDNVLNGFLAFLDWEEKNNVKWLESEKPIVNTKHGYAGTLDFIAEINGNITCVDIKTSKAIYPEYKTQVAAYLKARNLLREHKTMQVTNRQGEAYNVDYSELPEITHAGILRLDKETALPEYKDITKYIDKEYKAFCLLVQYYYAAKKRRLKNNPFIGG
jgi:hypothetical protein